MASLLLHAGQGILLKLLSEVRNGSWVSTKALHWQQNNKICYLIES